MDNQYRSVYRRLRAAVKQAVDNNEIPYQDIDQPPQMGLLNKILFTALIVGIVLIGSCEVCHSQDFSDQQYVNAIYLAEGGSHAQYFFGIRSIHYTNKAEARCICANTVRNNKRRFKAYGFKKYSSFIQFLASRFCPTTGRDLTASERRLNGNWIRNVQWFLNHPIV